jgi:hypothetical protein
MESLTKTNKKKWRKRLLIGTPTEGLIRHEWAERRYGQVIPVNWEAGALTIAYTTIGFSIADAYNCIVKKLVEVDAEWLITVEDDVIIPPNAFLELNRYMDFEHGKIPVVSGLYYNKGQPSGPLVFRGRGNGVFNTWKHGDKVWCDGLPMGLLLVHTSILKYLWDQADEYTLPNGETTRRIFETPRVAFMDPETWTWNTGQGTQDLHFCDQLLADDKQTLKATGWKGVARRKWPFLCDTSILCGHIDRNTGRIYP